MNRVPTYDLLLRRNIAIPSSTCPICNNQQETSHHLFLTCSFADELWTYITVWCKLASGKPSNIRNLLEIHKQPTIDPSKAKHINLVILSYIWIIWKTRNYLIFSHKIPSSRYATKEIKSISFLWYSNRTNSPRIEWTKWSSFNF